MRAKIFTDGLDGFAKRAIERAKKIDRGERIEPSRGITFESPIQMFEVLTVERLRVLEAARKQRLSVSGLARELGRDPKSVRRDVAKLEEAGVVRTREEINPGHGRVKIVVPVAKRFELRASF